MYRFFWKAILIAHVLLVTGCATTSAPAKPDFDTNLTPVQRESDELRVTLLGIIGEGYEGTLVQDAGWREFLLKIENRGTALLTVKNVKLLNVNGRYLDSASSYNDITAPPDVGAEVAGDVATSAAGIAAGQVIPYGGFLARVFTNTASASSAQAKANAKREFGLRVIKNVELAPAGAMSGSAFLPNITNAKALVVDYAGDERKGRLEIPLSTQTF